jgi:hypothetical protein
MDNQNTTAGESVAVPEGYEQREVIWPGTGERFMALFPQVVEYADPA